MPLQRCITVQQWRFVIKYHLLCQHSCNEYLLPSVFHSLLRLELESLLVFVSLINLVNKLWGSLQASSPGCSGCGAGIFNSTSNSPVAPILLSCQLSAHQCETEMRATVNKHWKIHAKGNDVITNVIYANQHFALTFWMQIVKFQRRSCKLSILFPPHRKRAPESLLTG